MVFRSKVDGRLVWGVRLPMVAAVALIAVQAVRRPDAILITVLILVALAYAIIEWIFASTYYTVDQDFVRIRTGPFRKRILISDIRSISRSDHRLEIRDGNGRTLRLSPRESELFVESVRSINTQIELVSR